MEKIFVMTVEMVLSSLANELASIIPMTFQMIYA